MASKECWQILWAMEGSGRSIPLSEYPQISPEKFHRSPATYGWPVPRMNLPLSRGGGR